MSNCNFFYKLYTASIKMLIIRCLEGRNGSIFILRNKFIAISDYLNQCHRSMYVSWEQSHLQVWKLRGELLSGVSGWFSSVFCVPWLREDRPAGSVPGGYVQTLRGSLSPSCIGDFKSSFWKIFFFLWGFADFFVILFMQNFLNLLVLRAFFKIGVFCMLIHFS